MSWTEQGLRSTGFLGEVQGKNKDAEMNGDLLLSMILPSSRARHFPRSDGLAASYRFVVWSMPSEGLRRSPMPHTFRPPDPTAPLKARKA